MLLMKAICFGWTDLMHVADKAHNPPEWSNAIVRILIINQKVTSDNSKVNMKLNGQNWLK